jgi:hypothetical protein
MTPQDFSTPDKANEPASDAERRFHLKTIEPQYREPDDFWWTLIGGTITTVFWLAVALGAIYALVQFVKWAWFH